MPAHLGNFARHMGLLTPTGLALYLISVFHAAPHRLSVFKLHLSVTLVSSLMQEWPQATQHSPTWPHDRQSRADAAQVPGQPEAAASTVGSAHTRPGAAPNSPRSKQNRQKPWGSSMAFRSSSTISNGRGESGPALKQGMQPARRGLSQESLRQQSGFSMSSLLDSFLGGRADSSRSEGNSPRQDIRRSPSFMGSTKSSQAHVHVQLPQAAAAAAEADQDTHRHAFRPSGGHVVIHQGDDAQHAAESKAQHAQQAQHGHGELSPRSVTSAHASSFMDSTESSRAHHHANDGKQSQMQHDQGQHAHQAADHDLLGMQQSLHGPDAESTAVGRGAAMQPADPHTPQHKDDPWSVHQADVHESDRSLQSSNLKRGASLSSKGHGGGDARRPSFMRPTAISLAHTASGPQTSLDKSLSMSNI